MLAVLLAETIATTGYTIPITVFTQASSRAIILAPIDPKKRSTESNKRLTDSKSRPESNETLKTNHTTGHRGDFWF